MRTPRLLYSTVAMLLVSAATMAQGVSISDSLTDPHPSAMLDVQSTTKGVLVPRLSTAQRTAVANPAAGLLVYDTDQSGFWFFDGAAWQDLSAGVITYDANNNLVGGDSAGSGLTTGANNILLGLEAGKSITAGGNNIAIGPNALAALEGSGNAFNVAIGFNVGRFTQYAFGFGGPSESPFRGFGLTVVGHRALEENTDGTLITALGYQAVQKNTVGADLTALGAFALNKNTTGVKNVAVGFRAQQENTTGNHNTAVGFDAGFGGQSNANCSYFGADAKNDATANSYTNSTALGYQATITASNQVRIGNADVTSIGGQVAWSTLSDGRYKTHVTENVAGLDFIGRLRPVTYRVDRARLKGQYGNSMGEAGSVETGFIAQEVEQAAQQAGFAFDGVTPPQHADDYYTLSYAKLVVPLTKAVQELQALVRQQAALIETLSDEVSAVKAQLDGEHRPATTPALTDLNATRR